MAFTSRSTGTPSLGLDPETGWAEPEKAPIDWIKRALLVGLAVLSWVATYVGMLELIEANMGDLPLIHKAIIGFSVAMLMTMVVWLLDEMFKPNPFFTKILYALGYLFLTIISIGFGFGFYWKVLESRSEASRSAESAVGQVQGSLIAASTRLEQLTSTLDQLTAVSTTKAQTERASGTSCPNSKPGDGPRRKLREDDAARFSFAADFVKGRATAVKAEMGALDVDLAKITSDDKSIIDPKSGTRNAFMQGLSRKLDNTVTGFNAFRTDPQLKQIRTDLAERGEKSTFPDSQGKTYSCPDPQLQTALRGVVRAIDQLPELEKPKIAAVEGSEATIEAFRRLTASFYGLLSFKLPPSADELRDLQKKAIQSVEAPAAATRLAAAQQPGLSKRDYVPLAIAVFVDLCLLLVSMGKSHDRLSGLLPKMRKAEQGPVIQILSRFNEIHRDRQIRENFELFRHVVFDFHGDYYVAVPLDAPRKLNPREREELRLETQLLSNLFASFEKEKIFSRVYSPFLTNGTIRKRLARQGSKFDRSDAFRTYRFKDGAWSDIILGAVMGAAKRVEAEKRAQTARADAAIRTAQPTQQPLSWPTAPADQPSYSPNAPTHDPRFGLYAASVEPRAGDAPTYGGNVLPLPQRGTTYEPQRGTTYEPQRGTTYEPQRGTTYEPQRGTTYEPQRGTTFEPQRGPNFEPQHGLGPEPTRAMQPGWSQSDAAAFDGGFVQPQPVWPMQAVQATAYDYSAANSNTMPAVPPVQAVQSNASQADVLPFVPPVGARAAAQPPPLPDTEIPDWQRDMGLILTRVTEQITVPVSSQARLPQAFLAAGFLPPKPPLQVTASSDDPVGDPPVREGDVDTWTQADTALIRKYANGPAE